MFIKIFLLNHHKNMSDNDRCTQPVGFIGNRKRLLLPKLSKSEIK